MLNRQLNAAMIGAGFIADYHIPALQAAGARVLSVCSRTPDKARAKAAEHAIPEHTADYSALLSREELDVMVIATPDNTHKKLAIEAANAGKHIILQKPMAPTSAECNEIIEAAERNEVQVHVSFMHRYLEEIEALQELLSAGALGPIYTVRLRNATPGPGWGAWFYSKEHVPSGVLLQLGVHGIDLLRLLFGKIHGVKATSLLLKRRRTLHDGSVITADNPDTFFGTYRMDNEVYATHEMQYNEFAGTDRFKMEVYGDRGTAILRGPGSRLSVNAPDYYRFDGWISPTLTGPAVGLRHHRHILRMLTGEDAYNGSASAGRSTLLVSEAIERAASNGMWEDVRE